MQQVSRRQTLQAGVAAGALALGGCLGGSDPDREPADRRVQLQATPPEGTWPRAEFDGRKTRNDPRASPPRSEPSEDWSVPASGASSLVVGPDRVYVSLGEEVLALSRDGIEQWRAPVGGELYYVDGRLYVAVGSSGTAGPLVGLDAASGEEVWRSDRNLGIADVVEAGGTVYVTELRGVYGFHADSGEKRWDFEPDGRYPNFLVDGERILALAERGIRVLEPGVHPLSDQQHLGLGGNTLSVPVSAMAEDTLFFGSTGAVVGYHPPSGENAWVADVDDRQLLTIGVTDEVVLATSAGGMGDAAAPTTTALDRASGTPAWSLDGPFAGKPAIAGGTVVVPTRSSLCAPETPVSECGYDDAATDLGACNAFDLASGELLWSVGTETFREGRSVALSGERILFTDADGIHAFS